MPRRGRGGRRILSPELDLLMLTRHASSRLYYHAHIPKLLADAAMVMKENVDFDKLRKLAARWHLPYPGDFLAAFPEFFPAGVLDSFGADPAKTAAFREVFELRGKLGEQGGETLFLSRLEAQGHVVGGVLNHLRTLTPDRIRRTGRLPEHGAWMQVALSYVRWFWTRTWRALSWIRRRPSLLVYAKMVESVESEHGSPAEKAGSR